MAAKRIAALGCALAVLSTSALATAEEADWKERDSGVYFLLGGGADALAFYFFPTAGAAFIDGAVDVRLVRWVDFRATTSLSFGAGVADELYFLTMLMLRPEIRFHPTPHYTIWLGYSGRLGVGVYFEEENEQAGVFPLHGVDLSLTSFRFGERGQFELELDGGAFLPPTLGYRAGLALRHSFEE